MTIDQKVDVLYRPLLARPDEGYNLFPGHKMQYDTNNGVVLVIDENGKPYVGIADSKTIEAIENRSARRSRGRLYVPHSNDGGRWICDKLRNVA